MHFMYGMAGANAVVARRWISRGGPVAWPPRSTDLNLPNFYLWGHLKLLVYSHSVDDVETLRNRTVAGFQTIRNIPGIGDRIRVAMRCQAEAYIQAGGGHLERLL
jgi:hypothetical protein